MTPPSSTSVTEGQYGQGTYTDTAFLPVQEECRRLLKELAVRTPGFTKDLQILDSVTFEGRDLPIIPGPIKSEAMTAVLQAMVGIVGQEILELKGIGKSSITINTNQASMYCATPALASIDGVSGVEVFKKYAGFTRCILLSRQDWVTHLTSS